MELVIDNNEPSIEQQAEDILNFLNEKAGKSFRTHTPKGQPTSQLKKIMARLEDGYTADDMRSIIVLLTRRWSDEERMRPYLRPDTLFGPETIEKYLGELG